MIPEELIEKVKRLEIKTRKLVTTTMSGSYQSAFKGKGMSFSDLRKYQLGDDVRSINWKVTARSDDAYVNLYEEERDLTILIMVDISGSGIFGSKNMLKKDLAAEIAAIFGFSAIRNSDNVGLILFSDQIESYTPPKKGKEHVMRILRDIFYVTPKSKKTNIGEALGHVMKMMKKRCVIFLISDFIDSHFQRPLSICAKKHDVIPILIEDPLENILPKSGIVALQDQETNNIIHVNTSSPQIQKTYKNIKYAQKKERDRIFKSTKCDVLELNTTIPYEKDLNHFFQKRLH